MSDNEQSERYRLPAELSEFESRLSQLAPKQAGVDRDELMFAAGYAAAEAKLSRRSIFLNAYSPRKWNLAMATVTAASVLLSAALIWQSRGPLVARPGDERSATASQERANEVQPAASFAATTNEWMRLPAATTGYLGVRYAALTRGMDRDLPTEMHSANGPDNSLDDLRQNEPATAAELLDELLPSARRYHPSRS